MEACGSVDEARAFIKRVRDAAKGAGRASDDVKCIARLNYCVAENGSAARDTMRARVGRNLVGGHMAFTTIAKESVTLPPEAVAKVEGVPYKAGLQPYEVIAPYVTDQMVDLMTLAGTVDEIVEHAVALCRSGIDGLIISPNPTPTEAIDSQIRIFGECIWPAVEKELAHG
jgi:5,10-methylenetetrahydromethanopterin reductase